MNLYDLMGPMAVGAGIGASYAAERSHGPVFWASILVGPAVGLGTFLTLRRLTLRVRERTLPLFYIGTPICVVTATIVAAWAVRASL
jgi:hypothetical protein